MGEKQRKWVIFGVGCAGVAASIILSGEVDFAIDNDIRKQNGLSEVPVVSLKDGKTRLRGKSVVMGTTNPVVEKEMRSLLSDSDAEQIISLSELIHTTDLSHLGKCDQYDYSEILEFILQEGSFNSYLYHMAVWEQHTARLFVNPMNDICEKYRLQGGKMADIACGYGFWSLFFAKKNIEVLGIDHDINKLNVFNRIAEGHSNMTAMEADIRNVKRIPDYSQDIAFCASTIHVVPDWKNIVSEMIRITRSGGFIILLIVNPDNEYVKNHYINLPLTQWDATSKNIKQIALPSAELCEKVDLCRDSGNENPTHSILVFSRK